VSAADVYAALFTKNQGSGIPGLNHTLGKTDHDNAFTAPTGVGETVDEFSHSNLSRAYAFEINVDIDIGLNLTLEVNTVTGALTMLGQETGAIDINFYEITSAGGLSLDPTGWDSLADQDFEGSGPVNNTGDGWEEIGGVGTDLLAEGWLLGDSTIAAGASIGLGMGYDQGVDAQDLAFTYRTDTGAVIEGLVAYEAGIPGDFDGNGLVDGFDSLLWQRDPGIGSLADWKANYGMGAPLAASSAVPEPSSILLLAAGAAGFGMWRKKRAG
jgi:hypothetical protein